jgi:hypothetical protein
VTPASLRGRRGWEIDLGRAAPAVERVLVRILAGVLARRETSAEQLLIIADALFEVSVELTFAGRDAYAKDIKTIRGVLIEEAAGRGSE